MAAQPGWERVNMDISPTITLYDIADHIYRNIYSANEITPNEKAEFRRKISGNPISIALQQGNNNDKITLRNRGGDGRPGMDLYRMGLERAEGLEQNDPVTIPDIIQILRNIIPVNDAEHNLDRDDIARRRLQQMLTIAEDRRRRRAAYAQRMQDIDEEEAAAINRIRDAARRRGGRGRSGLKSHRRTRTRHKFNKKTKQKKRKQKKTKRKKMRRRK